MENNNKFIVLAEDNPGDVFLVRRALNNHHILHKIMVVQDGEEALELVDRAEAGELEVDIFLVDLNLPKHDGGEILTRIRSSKNNAAVPVILLTSSDSPYDRERLLGLGANRYFRKPTDLHSFMEVGRIVHEVLSESGRASSLQPLPEPKSF